MFYYLAVFAFVFCLPVTTLAIECMKCFQSLKLDSPELFNITRPECDKKNEVGDMCTAVASINFEKQTAVAYLDHVPEETLTFSNGRKISRSTIIIWFSKKNAYQSIVYMDIDTEAIAEDISNMYDAMRTFKYEELRTKLKEHLYSENSLDPRLVCADNQGKTIECPNGFCQLTGNSTSTIDRQCIPQGKGTNPSGIQIDSSSIEGLGNATTIIYACNKAMCNGADTDNKVRQILNEYKVFGTQNAPPTPSNSAMTILYQTYIQWALLLIMTNLF